MIRLIYRHYCDRCHRVMNVEEYELTPRAPLPHPASWTVAGMDLCAPCATFVNVALRKAMTEAVIESGYCEGR